MCIGRYRHTKFYIVSLVVINPPPQKKIKERARDREKDGGREGGRKSWKKVMKETKRKRRERGTWTEKEEGTQKKQIWGRRR